MEKLLTIAVPSFNMEKHLPKNLATYADQRLRGALEVIVLDNASQDASAAIADDFVVRFPEIFRLLRRESRGYGSSINAALREARGKYFRIVDADDWVDTESLLGLLEELAVCEADVVQTNYCRVVMSTGEKLPFRFSEVAYGRVYHEFSPCRRNAPCIHSTAYRTALLREHAIALQDGIFFVDEEFVILPFLYAKSVIYYDLDIYRYLVGNPTQSTSPQNRAHYASHRDQIVRRLIEVYLTAPMSADVRAYCRFRIAQAAADHLTTLYIYLPDRAQGLRQGLLWEAYVKGRDADLYQQICRKGRLLRLLCRLHVSLPTYERLKKMLLANA
ncbi:MAG: glycosyltransferase [Oscillospiraceae bacterium]